MQQAIEVQVKREELKQERPVTVGILRDIASAEHQPLFADLAQWVAAGGDPNYAMNYALTHQDAAAPPRPNPPTPEQNNVRPTTIRHSERRERQSAGRVLTARVDAAKNLTPKPLP